MPRASGSSHTTRHSAPSPESTPPSWAEWSRSSGSSDPLQARGRAAARPESGRAVPPPPSDELPELTGDRGRPPDPALGSGRGVLLGKHRALGVDTGNDVPT